MKVLVIDDNKDITDVLSFYCDSSGIVCTTTNGLDTMHKEKYDLILLDLAMPDLSGYDVVKSLKKDGI